MLQLKVSLGLVPGIGLVSQILKVSASFFALILGCAALAYASVDAGYDPAGSNEDNREIINRYLNATRTNQISGIQMDAEVDASLPKLKKNGRLEAMRKISKLGKITWDHLHFSGDSTIKKEVIARFIQTEQEQTDNSKMAITPDNYKFKLKGIEAKGTQMVYVFHLTPRKKLAHLFKGELWIDTATYLPVHEAGTFVKSPSVFLTKVQFVRDYEVLNGYAVPKHVESQAETRFWGPAQVTIHYNNFVKSAEDEPVIASPEQN